MPTAPIYEGANECVLNARLRAGSRYSGVFGLGRAPQPVEQLRGGACSRLAKPNQLELDMPVAARESLIGTPERRFRIEFEVAREVHDREQEVAELRLAPGAIARGDRSIELREFLLDLGARTRRIGPVEPRAGGARAKLPGARERRQGDGDVRQCARLAARRALLALHAFPGLGLRGRPVDGGIAENVRVPAGQLVADRCGDVVE